MPSDGEVLVAQKPPRTHQIPNPREFVAAIKKRVNWQLLPCIECGTFPLREANIVDADKNQYLCQRCTQPVKLEDL